MKRFVVGAVVWGVALLAGPAARGQSFLGKEYRFWMADLGKTDAETRRSAAFALGQMGASVLQAVPQLLALVEKDGNPGVREAAATAVGDMVASLRTGGRVLPEEVLMALRKSLDTDEDARVKRGAAYAMGAFGPAAAPALESLKKALKDPDPSVRQNAAWAVGQVGARAGPGAVAELTRLLSDKEALVRRDAAGALGAIARPDGGKAVPALLDLIQGEGDAVVSKSALNALLRVVGPEHRTAKTEALDRLLESKEPEMQRGAAFALANIGGPKAAKALPVLRKSLQDDDVQVQALAAAALAGLGPEAAPAVPDLAAALKGSKDTAVRRNCALALGHVGAAAKPAVPALVDALEPAGPTEVRQHAAEALAKIEFPHIEAALPDLLKAIQKDTDGTVRQRCVWALFRMGDLKRGGALDVLSAVLEETTAEQALVRYDAARLLAALRRADAPDKTADVLLEMLTNKSLRVYSGADAAVSGGVGENRGGQADVKQNLGGDARFMAAEAMGFLGAKAKGRKDVLDALKEAAKDPDLKLRKTAEDALKRIGE